MKCVIEDGGHYVAWEAGGMTIEEMLPHAAYSLYAVKVPHPKAPPELLQKGAPVEAHRRFVAEVEEWNEGLKAYNAELAEKYA